MEKNSQTKEKRKSPEHQTAKNVYCFIPAIEERTTCVQEEFKGQLNLTIKFIPKLITRNIVYPNA